MQAYLDIDDIMRIARSARVDAIHPGYGFLSENPDFASACAKSRIRFVGPTPAVMTILGNKVTAREAAVAAGVPVMPATGPLPPDVDAAQKLAGQVGYPLMLKASWGGGGRGMRVIENAADLAAQLDVARREAKAAFGNDEVYLEKLIRRAKHVEVQILGDTHGNIVHLFERDCSVQRRNQKIVERAPAYYLDQEQRSALCDAALRLARSVSYTHAGTVEFLLDADSGKFYFIEVNPRIQVEHTVTEEVTGVDIVRAQIRITQGAQIGVVADVIGPRGRVEQLGSGVPAQADLVLRSHALQCRVTTEDPENNFTPDYGRITAYRSAGGFGVRLDGGTAYPGAIITPYYDSLLVKVTTRGQTPLEAVRRMDRALREFRIRGVTTNLQFVENVINHPAFTSGEVTTQFIDTTPKLFNFVRRRDRATRLLRYLGEVTVNGHPDMKGRVLPDLTRAEIALPSCDLTTPIPPGSRDRLRQMGAAKFAAAMNTEKRVLLTDTTMRDAHQSLLATRMRTFDMLRIAPYYARLVPELFSLECWGGATFDVALRFLKEDPWERLSRLREQVPNILFQMLLRGANAVGYTSYADNVVRFFVQRAAHAGIDLFRIFDSLNWVNNMRVSIDAVLETGALCEGAICYTGDIFDTGRSKYNLKYYIDLAKELERAGVHILCIKDMAGVCRPRAAAALFKALREEVGLPLHFHTHDTSGISAASVLAAIENGCVAVDGAIDAFSGLTSQPNLNAIVAALEGSEHEPAITRAALQPISHYWEGVRKVYAPFESDIRAGTADVYRHEMPGGQYTNLREQARSMGLEPMWPKISQTYAEVNMMFGDIVKVTPTSKVVGDMALFMVANDLSAADVMDAKREVAFPASVVSLFKGELGFPPDGFPAELSRKVLRAEPPAPYRPGDSIPDVDIDARRLETKKIAVHQIDDDDLASYLMYPEVYRDYAQHRKHYGDVAVLPTPAYYYGLREREEISVEIDPGKALVISMQGTAPAEEEGYVKVFFELNGQARTTRVEKAGAGKAARQRPQAEAGNPAHIAAPMPGVVTLVAVKPGQPVKAGDPLFSIEAMKMESQVRVERDATIKSVHAKVGETVAARDLVVELEAEASAS